MMVSAFLEPRKFTKPVPWSAEEKAAVFRQLAGLGRVPRKEECELALLKEPVLGQRRWGDIKNYYHNNLNK